jgi:hypothetical protein
MAIRIIEKKTDADDILLKKFIVKVAKGGTIKNKEKRDRISQLIMMAIHKTEDQEVLDYLWSLQKKLYPEQY